MHLEIVGRLRVQRPDGRVETTAIACAHDRLVQGAAERVEGDVDRAAVGTRFLLGLFCATAGEG